MSGDGIRLYRDRVGGLKTLGAKLVLAEMAMRHIPGERQVRGFTQRGFARDLSMSRTTIRNALDELLEAGVILIMDGAVYLRVPAFDTLLSGPLTGPLEGEGGGPLTGPGVAHSLGQSGPLSDPHKKKKEKKSARDAGDVKNVRLIFPRDLVEEEVLDSAMACKDRGTAYEEFAEKRKLVDALVSIWRRPETSEEWRQVWAFVMDHEEKARKAVADHKERAARRFAGE